MPDLELDHAAGEHPYYSKDASSIADIVNAAISRADPDDLRCDVCASVIARDAARRFTHAMDDCGIPNKAQKLLIIHLYAAFWRAVEEGLNA